MVLRARRQTELLEDARHVLLHGARRDEEALRDRLVRAALGHLLEHLALAGGELVERILAPTPPHELAHDRRIERRAALADTAHRGGELVHVRDPVLQQVADAFRVLGQELHRVARLHVLREHEHARAREALADLLGRAQTLVGLGRRHADVHDRHARLVHRHVSEQVLRGAGLGRHLEAGLLEQARDALAKEDRVVGEDDAHPLHQLARVPERREVHRQVRREQLVEELGRREPEQLVLSELLHLAFDLRDRVGREDDLPAVARLADARRPVDVDADVAVLVDRRRAVWIPIRTRTGASSGQSWARSAPLGRDRGAHGLGGVLEDGEQLVSVRVDLVAALLLGRRPDQPAHVREGATVGVPEPLDEAGRAFDVAEEEADLARRQVRHLRRRV